MSRALRLALAFVVAAAAVVGLLLFVQSREKSTFDEGDGAAAAPGQTLPDQGAEHRRPPEGFRYASNPPASGPHLPAAVQRDGSLSRDQLLHALEQGNVVLQYGDAAAQPSLRALQEDVAGPFDPALAEAGQAVVLDREPGRKGVVALAWRHLLQTGSATAPELRAFTEAYLGKGADG